MDKPRRAGIVWSILLVAAFAGANFMVVPSRITSARGDRYEQITKHYPGFDIRMCAYHEKVTGFALPGGIFVVESRPAAGEWKEIFETGYDDPVSIPLKIHQSEANSYYIVGDRELVVTVDEGRTWHSWTTGRNLDPTLLAAEYLYVKRVELRADLTGTMTLFSFVRKDLAQVHTRDGGLTWIGVP